MKLHHFGFVVHSIEQARGAFQNLVPTADFSGPFHDPVQRVRVAFLPFGHGVSLELIEPCGPDSPVQDFLSKGGGLHHICFQTQDLEAEVRRLEGSGYVTVCPPVPAVAFANRRIAFLFGPQVRLIELLET